jgi:hypothetical protein
MNETKRVLELLRKAVANPEDGAEEKPVKPLAVQSSEDGVLLEGTIGRPEFKLVGTDGITLLTFGLKVRTPEGQERWCNAQEWRKVALWGNQNLDSGSVVQALGRWEKSTYNGRETPFFSARLSKLSETQKGNQSIQRFPFLHAYTCPHYWNPYEG